VTLIANLFLGLLIAGQVIAGERVDVNPGPMPILAESLVEADAAARHGFAEIMLSSLQANYENEWRLAASERPRERKRAVKLQRWQGAMQSLIAQISAARMALSDGAEVSIRVDPQRQVLLQVGDSIIAFTTPRAGEQQRLAEEIVATYCRLYDCRVLDDLIQPVTTAARRIASSWALDAGHPPAFVVEGVVRCEFPDLQDRHRRQQACTHLADEALLLIDALERAQRQRKPLAWEQIRQHASSPPQLRVTLNPSGDYLIIDAPGLASLGSDDWWQVTTWAQQRLQGTRSEFTLSNSLRLLR
jgi:hypothetical protein